MKNPIVTVRENKLYQDRSGRLIYIEREGNLFNEFPYIGRELDGEKGHYSYSSSGIPFGVPNNSKDLIGRVDDYEPIIKFSKWYEKTTASLYIVFDDVLNVGVKLKWDKDSFIINKVHIGDSNGLNKKIAYELFTKHLKDSDIVRTRIKQESDIALKAIIKEYNKFIKAYPKYSLTDFCPRYAKTDFWSVIDTIYGLNTFNKYQKLVELMPLEENKKEDGNEEQDSEDIVITITGKPKSEKTNIAKYIAETLNKQGLNVILQQTSEFGHHNTVFRAKIRSEQIFSHYIRVNSVIVKDGVK